IDTGEKEETVTLTLVDTSAKTITAIFATDHAAGAPIAARGGFSGGVVPTGGNGSTGNVLKIFGDINADGKMQYVEYKCDIPNSGTGNLYRNAMAFDQAPPKPTINASMSLVN